MKNASTYLTSTSGQTGANFPLDAPIDPAAGDQFGVALDGFDLQFDKADNPSLIRSNLLGVGLNSNNTVMRAITNPGLVGESSGSGTTSLVAVSAPADSSADPEIQLAFLDDPSADWNVGDASYACIGIAGFDVSLGSAQTIRSLDLKINASGTQPEGGVLAWSPEVTASGSQGDSTGSIQGLGIAYTTSLNFNGGLPFCGINWYPSNGPSVAPDSLCLPFEVGAVVGLIYELNLVFEDGGDHSIYQIAASAGNESLQFNCTKSGDNYNLSIRTVPSLMIRDQDGNYLDPSESCIKFRFAALPGTAPAVSLG